MAKNVQVSGNDIPTRLKDPKVQDAFALVMPSVVNKDRFFALASAYSKSLLREKKDIVVDSVMVSIYEAAKWGLDLNPTAGEAYLVPFWSKVGKNPDGTVKYGNVVQCIPGYKGLMKLARQGGATSMRAHVVYEQDVEAGSRYWEDDAGQHEEYRPTFKKDRGAPCYVVSVATREDGSVSYHFMPYHKVLTLKARVTAKNKGRPGPWDTDEEAMAVKSALRAHTKFLPLGRDVQEIVGLDEALDAGKLHKHIDLPEGITTGEYEEVIDAQEDSAPEPVTKVESPEITESFSDRVMAAMDAHGVAASRLEKILVSVGVADLGSVPEDKQDALLDFIAKAGKK